MGRGSSVPSHSLRLSRSLSPPPRSLLYLLVYLSLSLSLSLCFESVFFLFMGRACGREQRRQYIWWYAGVELITYMNLFIFLC